MQRDCAHVCAQSFFDVMCKILKAECVQISKIESLWVLVGGFVVSTHSARRNEISIVP